MIAAAVVALAPSFAGAESGPIRLANMTNASPVSGPWRNGLELALREINARGGILKRQVVLIHVEAAELARNGETHLVLAPQAPSPSPAVPVLSADRLTGDPSGEGEMLAGYIAGRLKPTTVVLVAADGPETRELRDGVTRGLAARRIGVAAEIPSAADQVDFSAVVLRAKSVRADALVALVDGAAARRLLAELNGQGYDRPVIGGAALAGAIAVAPRVNVRAVIGLHAVSPLSPIRDMARSYAHAYGVAPPAIGLAGYSALYVIKAVSERAGRLDAATFAQTLKGITLHAAEHPGVLLDIRFDELGYGRRGAVVVGTRNGQPAVLDLLPP